MNDLQYQDMVKAKLHKYIIYNKYSIEFLVRVRLFLSDDRPLDLNTQWYTSSILQLKLRKEVSSANDNTEI